jgi:PKD repeat protein
VINGHFYWYQEEWSNQNHKCVQRFTLSGSLPVAKFTATAGTGNNISFNASNSTSTSGIAHYNWQFNDGPGLNFPVERTTPTVSRSFPSVNPFVIGLTVLTSDGTSGAAGGLVTPGHSGFTLGFTFSPSSPVSGSPVTFSGITTIAGRSVHGYSWDFGDGKTGSGATPAHTYSAPGTYKVRLVLFSSGGTAVTKRNVTVG